MRAFKLIFPLCLFSFLCICFFSCSETENPIIPTPPIDPSDTVDEYRWQTDTLVGNTIDNIYQLDSEHVYLTSYPKPFIYQNRKFNAIGNDDYDFYGIKIKAFSAGYVVAAGWKKINNTPQYTGAFRVFKESSIETFMLPSDTLTPDIIDMLIIATDDIWFITGTNKLYHFNKGNYTVFSLSENLKTISLLLKNNEVYVMAGVYNNIFTLNIFKFSGSEFTITNSFTNPDYSNYIPFKIQNEFMFYDTYKLYSVNGNYLEPFSNLPNVRWAVYTGNSKNYMIRVQGLSYDPQFIYTWNGIRWKQEKGYVASYSIGAGKIGISEVKNGYLYFFATSDKGISFIIEGKRKN
ncbi:MAG: hypothetical protein J0M18_21520 [Ignavibacteria bacterium]|nr:hypothetical protein [Ignavibacteria bacterium]